MTEKHPPAEQPTLDGVESEQSIRILMVEDNPDHAILARKSLEKCSAWLIDEAANMSEAFEKMARQNYQVLLVDYCLPDGYGLDLLDWVDNGCAVVMMTGQGSERVAVEAFKRGALDYVVKDGLFREVLPEIVEQAIAKNEALKRERASSEKPQQPGRTAIAYSRDLPVLNGYLHTEHLRTLANKFRRHLTEIRGCIQIVCYNPEQPINENQQAFLEAALEYCEQLEDLVSRITSNLPGDKTDSR